MEVKDQTLGALPASHKDLFHNRNEEQDWQERAIRLINSKIIRERKRRQKKKKKKRQIWKSLDEVKKKRTHSFLNFNKKTSPKISCTSQRASISFYQELMLNISISSSSPPTSYILFRILKWALQSFL